MATVKYLPHWSLTLESKERIDVEMALRAWIKTLREDVVHLRASGQHNLADEFWARICACEDIADMVQL